MLKCGHNFCKSCILKCWEKPPTSTVSCPQCRETVQPKSWMPNRQLANIVEIVKQLSNQVTKEAVAGGVCDNHQEPLKFFCEDDEALICVVCERSKRHREHRVVPADEAVEEYKDQICNCLENLRKKKEELLACKENTEKQSQDLLDMIERERQKTVDAFRLLREFLEEEEKLLLAQMEEVDEEDIARLSEELSSLENTIREMEEKCEMPPGELLKDITSVLQRCEQKEKFEILMDFPSELKWRCWNFWEISLVLENIRKEFKGTLKSQSRLRKGKDSCLPGESEEDEGHSSGLPVKHRNGKSRAAQTDRAREAEDSG
ncbi:zinc finger protein RFP-like isoform X1 [Tiliqua scincoides]|uniref:zinc finger protein RFP-like isoform X1 n=1 Tax=Tiliqua scincoides TaxID=71010 RepID=UPI003461B4A2